MPLTVERFQPEGMNVRLSNGQPSYSHVVTINGTGKLVYIRRPIAPDIEGNCVGKGDMPPRWNKPSRTWTVASRPPGLPGPTWSRPTPSSPTSMNSRNAAMSACVISAYSDSNSTPVGVTRLAGPDFMIEIEAVAVVNG